MNVHHAMHVHHPDRLFELVSVGECMVELRARESLRTATELQRSYGGDTLNTLVTASRLGLRTAFISRVGNDPFGEGMRRAWEVEGVNVEAAPLVSGENGVYFIHVQDSEREFTYRRAGSAASQLSPSDIPEPLIAATKVLLISGITQAISANAQAATLYAARLAREHHVYVAYDPNYRPALWQSRGGLKAAWRACQEVLPFTDLLLPSHPADDVLMTDLADWHGVQVSKRGAEGAILRGASGDTVIPASPVTVTDSTGAGDAFNAGLISGLLEGRTLSEAVTFAHRVAGIGLRYPGAIPPRAEFHQECLSLERVLATKPE